MTQNRDFIDDLLVRARRGALSDAEQGELEQELQGSFEARLLFAAGLGFDAEASVEPGDDELVARMAARAQRPAMPEKRSRTRYFVQGALAGALATGLAIAGVQELRSRFRAAETRSVVVERPAMPAPGVKPAPRAPAAEPLPRITEEPPPAVATEPPGVVAPLPHPSPRLKDPSATPPAAAVTPPPTPAAQAFADAPVTPQTAAELFGAANRARVQGDLSHAVTLYRQLEATFPRSPEANAAHLSLGVLYLQQKQPAAALAQLRQRRAAGNASEAEALWTEAQVLRQLGRSAEERAALERLVQGFPGSAYIGTANRRLAELR